MEKNNWLSKSDWQQLSGTFNALQMLKNKYSVRYELDSSGGNLFSHYSLDFPDYTTRSFIQYLNYNPTDLAYLDITCSKKLDS